MTRQFPVFVLLATVALAAGQEEELPVLVRSIATVEDPAPPFEDGVFVPQKGETIAFLGGTNTFNQQRFGYLEEKIHLAWPEHELKIRNLGWQGDTIYHQARPRFFYTKMGDPQPGSSPDTRERTEPGIIFINFGKMESLEEAHEQVDCLPRFLTAYRDLLDHLETRTRRIVLVAPAPFLGGGPVNHATTHSNEILKKWVGGIRGLAGERGLLFADTFSPLLSAVESGPFEDFFVPHLASENGPNLSTNGIHLTDAGQLRFAETLAEQLKFPSRPAVESSVAADSLRQSILRKNRLWHQYYHPTNWAFLFGDRQHVPASRDHEDTKNRWFLKEVDALPPLIAETEADIYRYAREASKKK